MSTGDARAFVSRPSADGVIANPVGGRIAFLARGEQTGASLAALETVAAPGEGPPLHAHANEDECLYVVAGEMRFRVDDDVELASSGAFVFVPRGVPHTWQNVGSEPARMLVLFTPAGMERFFDRFESLGAGAPVADRFAAAAEGTGMTVLGPPLALTHPRLDR